MGRRRAETKSNTHGSEPMLRIAFFISASVTSQTANRFLGTTNATIVSKLLSQLINSEQVCIFAKP
jgi:hypothetical protein